MNADSRKKRDRRLAERAGQPESRKAMMRRYSKLCNRCIGIMAILFIIGACCLVLCLQALLPTYHKGLSSSRSARESRLFRFVMFMVVQLLHDTGLSYRFLWITFLILGVSCLVGM